MKLNFEIDEWVWFATTESHQRPEKCPDCQGNRYLTVTMGDGSTVTIDCSLCSVGYEPPRGIVMVNEYTISAGHDYIKGFEVTEEGVSYHLGSRYRMSESDLFKTKEEAELRSEALRSAQTAAEMASWQRKEKDTNTWAWNVRYHRAALKEAHRNMEYHSRKLEAARVHMKQERIS